jgi:hypothetical protein
MKGYHMKILLFTFLFTFTLCYSQYKIVDLPNWKLGVNQTDSNCIVVSHDLFELWLSKHNDTLKFVELGLYISDHTIFRVNPDHNAQLAGWSTTKGTMYYDLNGDTEFDLIKKLNHNRKPADFGPEDAEEYIICDDRIIQVQSKYLKIDTRYDDKTALDGHVYRMTPKGWVLIK